MMRMEIQILFQNFFQTFDIIGVCCFNLFGQDIFPFDNISVLDNLVSKKFGAKSSQSVLHYSVNSRLHTTDRKDKYLTSEQALHL